jgi:putative endonuclease
LDLGRTGEDAALALYSARGFRPVARNWRCRLGEIDLVLWRAALLVICEVKCRSGGSFGAPFEAVNGTKQRKLRALGEVFLSGWREPVDAVRFDVASVTVDGSGRARVHLFEDAF